ncbi:MAG: universal stress protein [Burkholderiales bacterium]
MHRMLVPYDGSDAAVRALDHAIATARAAGAVSIHLVTAHEPPMVYGEIAVYVSQDKLEAFQARHTEQVLAPARATLAASGVPFTEAVLIGPVAESIAKAATESGSDVIVMGTRGMGAIGNLLMGSVATKVVHLASVPVTLVK